MMTQKHSEIILVYFGPLGGHFTISICNCQRIVENKESRKTRPGQEIILFLKEHSNF